MKRTVPVTIRVLADDSNVSRLALAMLDSVVRWLVCRRCLASSVVPVPKAAYDAGLGWFAVAGVVASVIGAFYYLRIVFFMYLVRTGRPVGPQWIACFVGSCGICRRDIRRG
jgi:hypothetical protein